MRNKTIYEERATRMYNRREEQLKEETKKNERLQAKLQAKDRYIWELKNSIKQLCEQVKYLVSIHHSHE